MQTPTVAQNKPTTLAELIAKVESNNNQFATRFEPAYHPNSNNVSKLASFAHTTFHTAEILCSISYGLYQIMGDDLISLGLTCSPIEYCQDIELQNHFFDRYCITNNCEYSLDEIINDKSKREDFAKKYNGPGNIDAYATRLLSFM